MITCGRLLKIENNSDTATNWSETATTREDRLPSPHEGNGCSIGWCESLKSVVSLFCNSQ
jgi:hypothetical protein